jgi:signal transduction histidine kinase/CheY-like chemotaxis protein
MKIRTKLLITALATGFIPVTMIGGFAFYQSQNAFLNQAFSHLESVRENKKAQLQTFFAERQNDMHLLLDKVGMLKQNAFQKLQGIQNTQKIQLEQYFKERFNLMRVLSKTHGIAQTLEQFHAHFHSEHKSETSKINSKPLIYKQLNEELKAYKALYGYDNLFLIAQDGHIVYTLKESIELGKNVLNGALKHSHLKQAFQKGLKEIAIEDFSPYAPENNQPIAFLTAPLFEHEQLLGVLVLSFLPDAINRIVQKRDNLGKTGETYLIGDNKTYTAYRSDRVLKTGLIGEKKSGIDIERALNGESGLIIKTGSNNDLELSAYAPLKIPGLNWCILTTIQFEEILVPKKLGEKADFFAKYIRKYNYYDLFLIHPEGKIFYSVKRESDYLTNILTGQYAHSGLSQLIEQVLQTKTFGISDFSPYAPSNGEPAAFIAHPLLHHGEIELIVALQFSDQATNQIMQERAGMGQSGEAYLVGPDQLMRSNSFLDPTHRSIIASFANPTQGMVDTQATRSALAGKTGEEIIQDYRDKPVLSAYTPIEMGNTTWALIVEIDQAEALSAIIQMKWLLGLVTLMIGLIVLIFLNSASKRLTKPLLQINEHLKMLAQGKLIEDDIQYNKADEMGELIESSRLLKQGICNSISQANAIAAGDYQQEIQLRSKDDQLGQALTEMTQVLRETTSQTLKQDWLKGGQAHLNELMSGEQDINHLAKKIITFLTGYIEATVGLFYLLKTQETPKPLSVLECLASYAYTQNTQSEHTYHIGEGLVGQAALEQKTLFRLHAPEEYTPIIQSGLSQAVPRHVIFLPFLYENTLKGVIEIGSSSAFSDIQQGFLEQMMPIIGVAVNTAQSRTEMQKLLETSQQQTAALQKQQADLEAKQTELQQSNEELQSQSEELQAQQEELQAQQEELRQTNDMLEERTRDLEQQKTDIQDKNRRLEKTQAEMEKARAAIESKAKELELASRYKSEFLANMSHELRTPLNSLLILAQLLSNNKTGNLSEKQIEYAQTIHSAGTDLLTLINDILDLSKVEAGKVEIQRESVSLSDLMEMVDQKFRPMAENKGIGFQMNIADNVPSIIETDGQRLKQIINNLLSNAFKFTHEGEMKVTVIGKANFSPTNLGAVKQTGDFLAVSVSDTGIGIPKDKQQVIFEAFQQADGTTSRRYGGTGLGLSISRQLARLLGGELTLDSEEGKGSTFTLYLPESRAQRSAPQSSFNTQKSDLIKTVSPSGINPQATLKEKPHEIESQPAFFAAPLSDDRDEIQSGDQFLLIIEDDRKFSSILKELAQSKGFKCILAEDGLSGLQLAEQYQPNAILLDIGLPELDGWMVMQKLKENHETRHIPVHFMSAAEQSVDAKKMGAIGYLLKPVSMEQLGDAFKTIEQFLSRTVKNLLVIVDNETHEHNILALVEGENIQIKVVLNINNAFDVLQSVTYDCIILDMDIEQGSGSRLLEKMQEASKLCQVPMIVYAERDLTPSEEALLLQCADNIPIKSVKSPERLLDEATLFLHQIESKLPQNKRKMLRMVHDKEAILKHKKILIVDDDVRNTYALATVLEEKEMEIIGAKNGLEALSLLKDHEEIALVLMDIMMPEMDGYEAMREIRKQPKHRQLPIIALTAKAMKGDKAKCIEAGANDYLSKPVDSEKLISLMRVWLYR